MKKIVVLFFAVVMLMGGVQAQKKNVKPISKSPSVSQSMTISNAKKSVDGLEAIKLPQPETGMEMPLRDALNKRCTVRDLREEEISPEILSSLLWCAYGFNRMEEGKRVVPSAVNVQEFDIYVFTKDGVYLYDAKSNVLNAVVAGDYRKMISKQKHFAVAPVSIVMVANYDRMKAFKNTEDRDFYAAVDAGYISQDIYLFCSAADLGTVACGGIDRDTIHKILNITNGRAILAHPVGMK